MKTFPLKHVVLYTKSFITNYKYEIWIVAFIPTCAIIPIYPFNIILLIIQCCALASIMWVGL